jgi:hypothetical protein
MATPLEELSAMHLRTNQAQTNDPPPLRLKPNTGTKPSGYALEARPRLYGDYLLRNYLTSLISPGGVGKSIFMMSMFIGLSIGRDLLELAELTRPRKILLLNNEDHEKEMELRIAAVCKQNRLTDAEEAMFADNFHWQSGYTEKIKLVTKHSDLLMRTSVVKEIVDYCLRYEIDAISLDPLVSLHDAGENENVPMDEVVSVLRQICAEAHVGILFAHHARKGAEADTPDDNARGATSLIAGVRANYGLAKMTRDESKKFLLPEDSWMDMIRLDNGKRNYAPNARDATWFELKSTPLEVLNPETKEPQTEWAGVPIAADLQAKESVSGGWNLEEVMKAVFTAGLPSPFIKTGEHGEKLARHLSDTKTSLGHSALDKRMKVFPAPTDTPRTVEVWGNIYRVWTMRNRAESNRIEYHYEQMNRK